MIIVRSMDNFLLTLCVFVSILCVVSKFQMKLNRRKYDIKSAKYDAGLLHILDS